MLPSQPWLQSVPQPAQGTHISEEVLSHLRILMKEPPPGHVCWTVAAVAALRPTEHVIPISVFYWFLTPNPRKTHSTGTKMNEAHPPTWSSKTLPPGPPGRWQCAAPGRNWLLWAELHCCWLGSHWNLPLSCHPGNARETSGFLQQCKHGNVMYGWVARDRRKVGEGNLSAV